MKYFLLLFFIISNIQAQNIFVHQNPFYNSESINSINFVSGTGWAVGNYGLIVKTTNSGQSFAQQYIPSKANLKKIFIVDSLVCYLLDDSLRMYKTLNGGINWVFNNAFNFQVNDLYFINQNTGFISTLSSIGTTTNSGLNWTFVSPDNTSPFSFSDVNFINSQTGFVTGLNLTTNYAYVFKTTNSGLNWTWCNTTIDGFEINNTYFLNPQTGWCAGSRFENLYVMKTSNGGVNWTESPSSFNSFLPNNLYFENNSTGYITSMYKILKSTNGGANWFSLLTVSGVQSSYFVSDSVFYLADTYSRIFKSYNAGNTIDTLLGKWNSGLNRIQCITSNVLWCNGLNNANWTSTNGGTNWIYDYYSSSLKIKYTTFTDVNNGFALANRGTVYKTTNFGTNWYSNYEYASEIYSFCFLNSQTGWAFADNSIFRTTNSGINWSVLSNTNSILRAEFSDAQTGYGYNGNYLFKTINSGGNWTQASNGYISDYNFINTLTGWTVINADSTATIQRTTNGGNNWNQTAAIDRNIDKIRFINQSTGYLLSYNRIYRTTNSGNTWKSVAFPTNLRMFAMDLPDANTGWICGDNSAIFKLVNGSAIFVNNEIQNLPDFQLYQNYPNPFNSETIIRFEISRQSYVSLKVYDIRGREVKTLLNKSLTPDSYNIKFNSLTLSSGIYFYVLKTDNKSVTKKLVVLK